MPSRRKHKTKPLIAKVTELAFAAPQVVAHRVTRMAIAGPSLSERDRKEFERMGAEKTAAFSEFLERYGQASPACQSSADGVVPSLVLVAFVQCQAICKCGGCTVA